MPDTVKKTVVDFSIADKSKRRRRKLKLSPRGTLLWATWPTWFSRYVKFRRAPWTNKLWRRNESVIAFIVFSLILIVLTASFFSGGFFFLLAWILICVVMNELKATKIIDGNAKEIILSPGVSSRWKEPNPAALFESKRPVTLARVPDVAGGSFPLGINPGGMVPYSFLRPKHFAVFGDAGMTFRGWGQHDLVKYLIMRLFETTSNAVVLVLDKDKGGLELEFLRFCRGVVTYERADQAFRALRCVAGIIQDRRDGILKDKTNIVIVADSTIANILLKVEKSTLSEFVIDLIVQQGKYFNVTVIAAPSPKFNYMLLPPDSKDYFESAQFFTTGTYEVESAGKTFRNKVKSPLPVADHFLWRIGDQTIEVRGIVCSEKQIVGRIEHATQDFFAKTVYGLKYSPAISLLVMALTSLKFVLSMLIFLPLYFERAITLLIYGFRRLWQGRPAVLVFKPLPVSLNWPFQKKRFFGGYANETQILFDKFGALDFPEYRDLLSGQEDKEIKSRHVKINEKGDPNEWNPQPNEFTVAG